MAQELHRSTFDGGLDTDTNKLFVPANKYTLAENVSLSGLAGKFFSAENIKGTLHYANLFNYGDTINDILGVYQVKFKIGSTVGVPCVVVFALADVGGSGFKFRIYAINLQTAAVYQLYEKAHPGSWNGGELIIDAVKYSESNIDTLYFTDNFRPVGKLRCVIPSSYSANFLTDNDVELQKKSALGTITLDGVSSGGSLLTGTYQLAYQLINPEKNRYTKFSLLTNPIHVYTTIGDFVRAGVGLPSNKKIRIDINPTEDELSFYTHFRIAVVENINPDGLTSTEVGLTKVELISDYLSVATIANYDITSNTQYDKEVIDDIVVDLAAIDKVQTLEISDKRLLLGNVTYKDLNYDNGDPTISGGSILKQTGATVDSFSSDDFTSKYKGHFRGEVYRYAISYFDNFGNFSYPKTLDVSSVTNNQISGAIDMKFPDRSQYVGSTNYTLFNASDGRIQSLGLQLTGIDNHPTWAKGFIILRAKRKKNVEFQTPLIPMSPHYGMGAVGEYPTQAFQGAGAGAAAAYTNAIPAGPSAVYFPYNLFYGHPTTVGISGRSTSGGTTVNTYLAGETRILTFIQDGFNAALVYPPEFIYNNKATGFKGNEQLVTVDAAAPRLYLSRFDSEAYNLGSGLNSSCSGSFYAATNTDYYYESGHTGAKPAIRSDSAAVAAYRNFNNYDEGDTVGGLNIWKSSELVTTGAELGFPMQTQKSTAIVLNGGRTVLNYGGTLSFTGGNPVKVASTGAILNTTDFITSTGGLYASRINTIEIVNVTNNLQDTRYGKADDYNEFMFTGTKVVFTNSEVTSSVSLGNSLPKTVDVWGGDCIVSPHTFKVADTSYSMINQVKGLGSGESITTALAKWTRIYRVDSSSGAVLMQLVPIRNAAQYLTVVLESEYNGHVRDLDTYDKVTTAGFNIPGQTAEDGVRAPMSYAYNININKENDLKLFIPKDPLVNVVNPFGSRILYSDLNIYQTNIEGFDTFRVLNSYDLDDGRGSITKLILVGDNLYAVQKNSISYLATQERLLELTDASTLGVKSGDIFGNTLYIDSNRGGQHTRGVLTDGKSMFVLDNRRKSIYKVAGQSIETISDLGLVTPTNTNFVDPVAQNDVVTFFDYHRKHAWFLHKTRDFCYIWNDKYNFWETKITSGTDLIMDGVYLDTPPLAAGTVDDQLLLIGNNNGTVSAGVMYAGNRTEIFGQYINPKIGFSVNSDFEVGKVFDNLIIGANNKLDSFDVTVEREALYGTQSVVGTTLNVDSLAEGTYRVEIPESSAGNRMRGLSADVVIYWPSSVTTPKTNVTSVITKYQKSARVI